MNIGVHNSPSAIMKEGKISQDFNLSQFTIPKSESTFTIYLSSSEVNGSLTLQPPSLTYDQNILQAIAGDQLKSGGQIDHTPKPLSFIFACQQNQKAISDVQALLTFANQEVISLSFKKECHTADAIEEYFNVLYAIYWGFLIVIFVFLFSIIYYYMKKNSYSIGDLYEKIIEEVKIGVNRIKNRNSEETMKPLNSDSTERIDLSQESRLDEDRNNMKTNDIGYGGI